MPSQETLAPEPTLGKVDRQAALFDAAMALFAERAYDEVTVDDICARANVGRATFFRLFGSKAGLIEEANRRTASAVADLVRADNASGRAALEIMADVVRRAWMASPTSVQDMFKASVAQPRDNTPPEPTRAEGSRAFVDMAARFVREGQAAGAFRKDLDPGFMGLIFVTQLISTAGFWIASADRDPKRYEDHTRQVVSVMLNGMEKR
jgi:AcrR family transcriptional regulator